MTEVVFVSQLHEEKATLLLHIQQHDVLNRARTDVGWNYSSKYKIFYKNWLEKQVNAWRNRWRSETDSKTAATV